MSQPCSQIDVDSSLRRVITSLQQVFDRVKHGALLPGPSLHTQLQVLFNLQFVSDIDRTIYGVIAGHGLAAEKLGPGGFIRCIELLIERFGVTRDRTMSVVPISPSVTDLEHFIAVYAAQSTSTITAMIKEALQLAGFVGRIIVEKTQASVPSVELVRGYTFNLKPLLPIDVYISAPKAFCIDGYVETVSEIHHLLEAASDAHEPCVIFLRGASDDVKHTLKVNYDRGSLKVLPIGVNFDLDGMNTLVDLAVVTGCDLVSSLKGDLISAIKFQDAPRLDQVTVFKEQVIIARSVTRLGVEAHVIELRKRRNDEDDDFKSKLLDARIRSLSPNHVVIRLPDNKDYVSNSQVIDYVLRTARSATDYGITAVDRRLVATELAARVHAERCSQTLCRLGSVITRVV